MKVFFFLTAFLLISEIKANQNDSIKVMFYNVENLFDTTDDTTKNDNEFLPEGKKNWTNKKWDEKTTKIAKVIAAVNFPDVIGLAEVENKLVLERLTNHFILKSQNYKIIHFNSPDARGIDCALLYKKEKFDLLSLKPIPVKTSPRATRDILAVTLSHANDTINFLVNHWPSRFGGRRRSENKRIFAGQMLNWAMDSIRRSQPFNQIIAMGDFNDEPKDSSLKVLSSYKNICSSLPGTIKYRGKWQNFDQFITTKGMEYKVEVFKSNFLLEEDETYGGVKPNRTYFGPMFHGGFSDHLPVLLTFSLP